MFMFQLREKRIDDIKGIVSRNFSRKVQTHTNEGTDGQAGRRGLKRTAIVVYVSLRVFQSLI